MAQHFVPPQQVSAVAAASGPIPANSPAFAVMPARMGADWVAQFGCADLGPPPNTRVMERPWIDVVRLCKACGEAGWDIPLPSNFTNAPHVGGASCPFCAWVATNQGFAPMTWYIHPSDAAAPERNVDKPRGRGHAYEHQVFKCNHGLAIQHVLCRMDRDMGRGDANAALFRVQRTDLPARA